MKTLSKKIVGGKLLIIKIEFNSSIIKKIQILGDFFMNPEDRIYDLENLIVGLEIDEISEKLNSFFNDPEIEIMGFEKDDLINLIEEAFKQK